MQRTYIQADINVVSEIKKNHTKETTQQELEGEYQVPVAKKLVCRQSRKKKSRSSLKEERKLEGA